MKKLLPLLLPGLMFLSCSNDDILPNKNISKKSTEALQHESARTWPGDDTLTTEPLPSTRRLYVSGYYLYDDGSLYYDGVKVYFTQPFPYDVFVRISSVNSYGDGVVSVASGVWHFPAGVTSKEVSLQNDAVALCSNNATSGVKQRTLIYRVESVQKAGFIDVESSQYTLWFGGQDDATVRALCIQSDSTRGQTRPLFPVNL